MSRPVLHPATLAKLVAVLSPEEDAALFAYSSADGDDQFPYRATEWLVRRFGLNAGPSVPPGTQVIIADKEVLRGLGIA